MLETSFAAFCDGLAANSCLKALDLRNNQINHEGAEELASALKRNITLRALGECRGGTWLSGHRCALACRTSQV
jgi:hypothetical protein